MTTTSEQAFKELQKSLWILYHECVDFYFGTRLRGALWLSSYLAIYELICYLRP